MESGRYSLKVYFSFELYNGERISLKVYFSFELYNGERMILFKSIFFV